MPAPRIMFATIGTSAVENEELGKGNASLYRDLMPDPNVRPERASQIRNAELAVEKELGIKNPADWLLVDARVRQQFAGCEALLLQAHEAYWDRPVASLGAPEEHKRTSAELISSYCALRNRSLGLGGLFCSGLDRFVLMHSRSCIGYMAARINAACFRKYLFDGGAGGSSDVELEVINDLFIHGLVSTVGVAESLSEQITKIVQKYMNRTPDASAIFNITGSYKGVIPPVTDVASFVYPGSKILYMHESMDSGVVMKYERQRVEELRLTSGGVNPIIYVR
jgi:hypothetical protein